MISVSSESVVALYAARIESTWPSRFFRSAAKVFLWSSMAFRSLERSRQASPTTRTTKAITTASALRALRSTRAASTSS